MDVLWLSIGLPLWISWLSGSPREFSITSGMTHVGGMVVGVWAMRQMTWPRGIWWKAWLAIPLLQVLSHFTTKTSQEAREENVNISQARGEAAMAEELVKVYQSSARIVVAVCHKGPISVKPLKAPEAGKLAGGSGALINSPWRRFEKTTSTPTS